VAGHGWRDSTLLGSPSAENYGGGRTPLQSHVQAHDPGAPAVTNEVDQAQDPRGIIFFSITHLHYQLAPHRLGCAPNGQLVASVLGRPADGIIGAVGEDESEDLEAAVEGRFRLN
jgi:hypothetical protein